MFEGRSVTCFENVHKAVQWEGTYRIIWGLIISLVEYDLNSFVCVCVSPCVSTCRQKHTDRQLEFSALYFPWDNSRHFEEQANIHYFEVYMQ